MTGLPWEETLRPELSELSPYLPTLGDFRVRLDANEAPGCFSPSVRERLGRAALDVPFERYPDPTMSELRGAIADEIGVTKEEILVGVGSDEIITLLLTILSKPREKADVPIVVTTTPSFVMYKLSARVRGQRVIEVPLDADWDISTEGLIRAIEMGEPSVVFIASPNNPTSTMASPDRLEKVVQAATKSLVVIDEAYIDYSDRNQLDLYRRYPNVAMLRTLSKIGFAALRVGWLVARPELIREADKARLPYNLNTLSQNLATIALRELMPEVRRVCELVKVERSRMAAALSVLEGVKVAPSQANFLWFSTPRPAGEVFERLVERKVLVRSFHQRGGRLGNQLRVTVGTPEENDEFLKRLKECL